MECQYLVKSLTAQPKSRMPSSLSLLHAVALLLSGVERQLPPRVHLLLVLLCHRQQHLDCGAPDVHHLRSQGNQQGSGRVSLTAVSLLSVSPVLLEKLDAL